MKIWRRLFCSQDPRNAAKQHLLNGWHMYFMVIFIVNRWQSDPFAEILLPLCHRSATAHGQYALLRLPENYRKNCTGSKIRRQKVLTQFNCIFTHILQEFGKVLFHFDFNVHSAKSANNFLYKSASGGFFCLLNCLDFLFLWGSTTKCMLIFETSDPKPLQKSSDFHFTFPSLGKIERLRWLIYWYLVHYFSYVH